MIQYICHLVLTFDKLDALFNIMNHTSIWKQVANIVIYLALRNAWLEYYVSDL